MRWVRDNSLSLFFGGLFLLALGGQTIAGHAKFNEHQLAHDDNPVSWWRYIVSSDFGQAMLENWQSEWLQFALFALATVWLYQKGSNESKTADDLGRESEQKQKLGRHAGRGAPRWARFDGGLRRWIYSNSLILAFSVIFFGSWLAQSVNGWTTYNDEQQQHDNSAVSWLEYLTRGDFWEETLQNWQSEFLAVGTMAVWTIYLRQRGSPESKPVGSAHDETGAAG
jgi:hypothetical protein